MGWEICRLRVMSRAYWIYPAYGASSNERAAGTLDVGQDTLQAPNQPANQTEDPSAPNLSELSGQAAKSIWGVMMRSAPHRHLFVGDLEWLLMPPIACKQFRLWRRENMPVAFASWALLSDEVEARIIESMGATVPGLDAAPSPEGAAVGADSTPSSEPQPAFAAPRLRLAPGDWQSGNNLWLIDMVCPFGGSGEAAKQLREQTFKGQAVKTVRAKADGTGFEVGIWQ